MSEAIKNFRKCLHYAKENDSEAECLSNFYIGECLFKIGKEFEKSRSHLVDF